MSNNDLLTAYAVIKRANTVMSALGINKVLPTQMGYTYIQKGMFGTVVSNSEGKKCITAETADVWIAKYIHKNYPSVDVESAINIEVEDVQTSYMNAIAGV